MATDTLHDRLHGPVIQTLQKELGIKNVHALPRIEKVVISVGINKSKMDSKEMHAYIADSLARITGQKSVATKARKAISNFKTREGMIIGSMVTLRGRRMEEFLDRLLSYSLPRIRDFRGLKSKLDGNGNYSIGLRDHSIFPEIAPPDAREIFGMQIQITTTAENDEQGMALLKAIGMPFRRKQEEEATAKPVEEVVKEDVKDAKDAEEAGDAGEAKDEEGVKEEKEVASEEETTDTADPADADTAEDTNPMSS